MTDQVPHGPLWPKNARLVFDAPTLSNALDAQAVRIQEVLKGDENVTLMALMNGGMIPAAQLARRLSMPLRFDYVHATRYREARKGKDLQWVRRPEALSGTVVLVDDIFDEGHTMDAVKQSLIEAGAGRVVTVVAVRKQHDRGLPREWVDDAALEVPDEYVFGFGMDIDGLWRGLDSIWSVS